MSGSTILSFKCLETKDRDLVYSSLYYGFTYRLVPDAVFITYGERFEEDGEKGFVESCGKRHIILKEFLLNK